MTEFHESTNRKTVQRYKLSVHTVDVTQQVHLKGKGKSSPSKLNISRIGPAVGRFGNPWNMPQDLITELEEFTCAVYGKTRFGEVEDLRLFMIKEKCEDKPSNTVVVVVASYTACGC